MSSLLKSKWFWGISTPVATTTAYIYYDRYQERQILQSFLKEAAIYGEQPLKDGDPLTTLNVVAFGRDRQHLREIMQAWKKYSAPLLTAAGIDYVMHSYSLKQLAKDFDLNTTTDSKDVIDPNLQEEHNHKIIASFFASSLNKNYNSINADGDDDLKLKWQSALKTTPDNINNKNNKMVILDPITFEECPLGNKLLFDLSSSPGFFRNVYFTLPFFLP